MTKKSMIDYITSFETYPTMNSWNRSYGYSVNMKIHHLPVSNAEKDNLYQIIDDENLADELYFRIQSEIDLWRDENAKLFDVHQVKKELQINIEGLTDEEITERRKELEKLGWTYDRHGSTIMTLWKNVDETIFDAGFNGRSGGHLVLYRWNGNNYFGTGWVHSKEELEEMTKEDVRYIYKVLRSFQKLSETIIKTARYLAKEEIAEEEYTITKTRKVFKNTL